MPAIKVRALAVGTYGGHLRPVGTVFFLVDIKDPKTGKIKHKAEDALAEEGVVQGGWMERVVAPKAVESEAARTAREEKEAQEAAERDAAIAAGLDPDDPETATKIVNALGTGTIKAENQGMSHKAAAGSNAGDNASQSTQEVL